MVKTEPLDLAKYLDTPEARLALLNDAFASGEATYVGHALGLIARSRGMSDVARKAGVSREGLYKSLSDDGDPRLTTLLGVAGALGFRLAALPLEQKTSEDVSG
ncbi:putative addiction module antidote protein [Acidisoma cellulosilytica]|uniref:Addiction module antidote protein n=1 Tax=Acidisoma cellulosilyticum TaxID=2802395 RepID=A0A964E3A2_9PROT|nr:addiction module antidote protein [Acidisoma cellulosilyticum]MCB8880246.1 putative addiction module antidote protein [Acidisoma cellulosilyticum]